MNISEQKRVGVIALFLCLGGLVLAVLIGGLAGAFGYNASMPAYIIFLGFQVAAIVLGIVSRQTVMGKTAYITAAVLSVGSVGLIA